MNARYTMTPDNIPDIPVERGYAITDRDGMLEIEKIDEMDKFESDSQAVRQAIRDGVPFIMPDELPKDFPYRWFGWIDTPGNRKAILDYAAKAAPEAVKSVPVDQYGLVVTPAIRAYLNLHKDLADNQTWPILEKLIESGTFDAATKTLAPDLSSRGYFDFELAADVLDELALPNEHMLFTNFTGTVEYRSCKIEAIDTQNIIVIMLDQGDNAPDPMEQCRELLRDVLPPSFDYDEAIGTAKGSSIQLDN